MSPPRVLLVDDKEPVRGTLQDILFDFDCVFFHAENGVSALRLLQDKEFDVIFLDLKLPDVSGIEVLRSACGMGKVLGKVIILTGQPDSETRKEAAELGAFRYLTKMDWRDIRSAFADAISHLLLPAPTQSLKPAFEPVASPSTEPAAWGAGAENFARDPRPRLLVLDDDQRYLDELPEVLGNGFHVTPTTSADEACSLVTNHHFDLAVLDLNLPGQVSGLDVLSRMRRAVPTLPAIILTGYPSTPSILEGGRRGALDYILKAELASLAGTVQRILAEQSPARVFLSYERSDEAKVFKLFDNLRDQGLLPWMDSKSIRPGAQWETEIRKAISECDYFLFCLSSRSMYKEGHLRKEIRQALDRQEGMLDERIFFITARLEECEVVEPFRKFQYVDLFRSEGLPRLLSSLTSVRRTAK